MTAPSLNAILRRKLVILVLAPSIVFTLALGSFIGYRQYTEQGKLNGLLAESLARYTAIYVEDALHSLRHVALSANKINESARTAHLANLYSSFPHFERILWLDKSGNIIGAYPSGLLGLDFPFQFDNSVGFAISPPVFSHASGSLILYLSHLTSNGSRIVAEMSLKSLRKHLQDFAPPNQTTTILLTDSFGNLIVHPDEEMIRQQVNVGNWELFTRPQGREKTVMLFRLDGVLNVGAVSTLPDIGWRLSLCTPLSDIFAPIGQTILFLILFLLGFFAIIATSFRYELHRRVVAPLSLFAATLQHAARGDYGRKDTSGNATFAELTVMENEFATMASEIAGRERDLRNSRSHLKSIIDSISSALLAVNGQGRITLMNAAAAKLCGIAPADAMGLDVHEVFPLLHPLRKHLSATLTMRRPATIEKHPGTDGARSTYYDLAFYAMNDEEGGGAVIRIEDVTTRAQLEEIMIQTEKMMSVGGLAAGMAHEINNPLGGILQCAQNIERRTSFDLPANEEAAAELGTDLNTVRAYLETRGILKMLKGITESGQRAAAIVSNMLNFSRRSSSHLAPCDLHELIERVLTLAASDYDLKKRYDFKKIAIERNFDPKLPSVTCTATEIEQVLLNLFKNAAQAMNSMDTPPERPTLTITTSAKAAYAELRIRDNGPGIAKEQRKRIFEPFFTTKAPGEGTGLGLSVSYFIVTNNHKGSFTVESEPGHGAEFIIRLPLTQTRSEEA